MEITSFKPEYISSYFPGGSSCEYYSNGKDVYPSTYLDFSKDDLNDGNDRRNRVNAVGNAKRAFHLQIEMLCDAFGWSALHNDKIIGFPPKLEFLNTCGILSPNILKKLNKKRNAIEHDYFIPSLDEVEDYLDIVELFIMATKSLLDSFPSEVWYELMKDDELDEALELPESTTVKIELSKGVLIIETTSEDERMEKSIKDSDYFTWLSAAMSHYVL
jgi:hypothetical protein